MHDKTLITGSCGMIGTYIRGGIRTTRESLDVTDLQQTRHVCAVHQPDVIIHLAAETDLNRCEADPAHAHRVNALGTYNIALVARELGAKLVYVSTSGVFDGSKSDRYTESDIPNPQNHYGHSKYLGELAVAGMLTDYLIVRVSWVFGGGPAKDTKFVGKILKQLQTPSITVVDDKRGSPTYGKDAVAAIESLILSGRRGLYHIGNQGAATRLAIATEIVALTNSSAQVIASASSAFQSSYKTGTNESMYSIPIMRRWEEALSEYVSYEWQQEMRAT